MTQEAWVMLSREIERLAILERVESAGLGQAQAAAQMGVSERHLRRLLKRMRGQGPAALVSRRRGRSPNNRLPDWLRRRALALVGEHYADFGPTLAHEKLHQHHRQELGAAFSVETLRQWMLGAGLWRGRCRALAPVHQSRPRRARFGELVQVDGSPHDWFEGRRAPCTPIAFIDDATSRVTEWRFFEAETTFAYMQCLYHHLRRYGVPLCLYSDRHSIFRVNAKQRWALHQDTQFSRALRQLRIEPICAQTPQAKGRVERLFQTIQDRLVKELRLHNIAPLNQANAFLQRYRQSFNRRFAFTPGAGPRRPSPAHAQRPGTTTSAVQTPSQNPVEKPHLPVPQHPLPGANPTPPLRHARSTGHLVPVTRRQRHNALQETGNPLPRLCQGRRLTRCRRRQRSGGPGEPRRAPPTSTQPPLEAMEPRLLLLRQPPQYRTSLLWFDKRASSGFFGFPGGGGIAIPGVGFRVDEKYGRIAYYFPIAKTTVWGCTAAL